MTSRFRRQINRLSLLLLLGCVAYSAQASTLQSQPLHTGWQFRLFPGDPQANVHLAATTWHSADVPGSVHTDLFAADLIPDPYVGAPEANLQWIGLGEWEYRTEFRVDPLSRKRAHADLVFEGLDTYADVYLNDEKVLSADNFFRTWRVPVAGRIRAMNTLRVVLHSPIRRLLPIVQAMPNKIAGNYPSPFGDEPRDAMTGNFVRKPGYHYGWDWGPRYVTAGIWRPVRLETWDEVRATDLRIRTLALNGEVAELVAEMQVEGERSGDATLDLAVTDPGGRTVEQVHQPVSIKPGITTFTTKLSIRKPRRWWPTGYGEQAMYSFKGRLLDGRRELVVMQRRTGLRTIELLRTKDAAGQGFGFVVNGVPIFAKGANVIPFDAFPARVAVEQQRRILESARDAHMNMIRLWGGGYYESDAFYDLADELGLLVWQDFMFGGGMPPAYDPVFRANVAAEAIGNVRRLRHHPSIVLWCGNNEEETAWKDWGQGAALTQADPAFAQKVWEGYRTLFGSDLRRVVAEEGNGVPYWASSPSNDLDEKANDSNKGDKHYWDVWAGSKPITAYLEETPRFMSEYGLESWPSLRTIDSFAKPAEQGVDTPVIRAHQKFLAGEGNARLSLYIDNEYGKPANFSDFVYLSQQMQADGIELAALHHRASRPRTMGSLYWQLNDVWPGASWASIDHYGRWKALQYRARHFFAPMVVAALRKDGRTEVSVISDRTESVDGELRTRVIDFDGAVHRDDSRFIRLAPLSATAMASLADEQLIGAADPKRTVVVIDLFIKGQIVSRGIVYFASAKDLALTAAEVKTTWRPEGDGYGLDLDAKRLTRGLWIDFGALDAELSDNDLTLLAGEPAHVHVKSRSSLADLRRSLTLRSLADVAH